MRSQLSEFLDLQCKLVAALRDDNFFVWCGIYCTGLVPWSCIEGPHIDHYPPLHDAHCHWDHPLPKLCLGMGTELTGFEKVFENQIPCHPYTFRYTSIPGQRRMLGGLHQISTSMPNLRFVCLKEFLYALAIFGTKQQKCIYKVPEIHCATFIQVM